MISRILRYSSIGMATMALGLGVAAASSVTVDHTGPTSHVKVNQKVENMATIHNNNDLSASNHNDQSATTGHVMANHNTTGGDAMSGAAMNGATYSTSATVNNSGSTVGLAGFFANGASHEASISTTGPDSNVAIDQSTKNTMGLNNHNEIRVTNSNQQMATSGSAEVSNNTSGGSATSGDSTNTASFTTDISVTN